LSRKSIIEMMNAMGNGPGFFVRGEDWGLWQLPRRGNFGKVDHLGAGYFLGNLKIYFCNFSGVPFISATPRLATKTKSLFGNIF